jgi:hypothetical protein
MVGAVVEAALLPQELRIAGRANSAKKKSRRSQRTLSRLKQKFGSNTNDPPARTTLVFLRKIRSLQHRGGLPIPRQGKEVKPETARWIVHRVHGLEETPPFATEKDIQFAGQCPTHETVFFPPPPKSRIRTPATNLVASRLGNWTESHSPRGIDAVPHHCVACRKAECDNRPLPPDKVKRNLHFPEISRSIPRRGNVHRHSKIDEQFEPSRRKKYFQLRPEQKQVASLTLV